MQSLYARSCAFQLHLVTFAVLLVVCKNGTVLSASTGASTGTDFASNISKQNSNIRMESSFKNGWHHSRSRHYDDDILRGQDQDSPINIPAKNNYLEKMNNNNNMSFHRPSSHIRSHAMSLRGGGIRAAVVTKRRNNLKEKSPPSDEIVSWSRRDLVIFQSSNFLIVLATAVVAFSPAPALIAELGSERATSTLSMLSACAALTEIIISPTLGSLLDSVGRKPALIFTLLSMGLANGAVSLHSSVVTICIAKFVGISCVGLFFIASQVIVSDICASNPERMSSTLGVQYSLIGGAFFLGAICAGWLSEFGLSVNYGVSTIIVVLTALLLTFGISETLLPSKKIPLQGAAVRKQLLESPWSCTRILYRYSKKVRVLALLLMVQSLPQFMGDTFQILAKTEWNLTTKGFSSYVAMLGIISIAANVVGSKMVGKLGIRKFTALATLSGMLSPLGASFFSFRGLVVGVILGFLGFAQMLGVTAALVAEGAKSNVPQGVLAGERASFLALMKVIGPIWYSTLYVEGKKLVGVGSLPFLFNVILGLTAFGISQYYL
uniref:Major facilitator superfamily (MFS) profile domain-containing protein n=1 Tax=Chaetoceros debilis TaxID=122233 RepID=A0A7S3QJ58_9STRA